MSLNIVYEALVSRIPYTRRTGSGWHTFNGQCCARQGHRPDRRKRAGIKFDGFVVVYNCFNCGYRAGWSPGSVLTKKMENLLTWMGVSGDTLKKLSFYINEYNYRQKMGGARVIIPHGLQSINDWGNADCGDPRFLTIAKFLLDDEQDRDLDKWFWTPDDNDCQMSSYMIELTGTLSYPTAWWGFPVIDTSLPAWTHRGPDDRLDEEEEISEAEWKALEAEFDAQPERHE